jgi:hypothetical protein
VKRTALKRRTPLKRGKRLRSVSIGRRQINEAYSRKRRIFLARHPKCQVRVLIATGEPTHRHDFSSKTRPCGKRSTQVHHIRRRGKWLLDERYWLATEFNHHRFIEENGKEAERLGYVERIYEKH